MGNATFITENPTDDRSADDVHAFYTSTFIHKLFCWLQWEPGTNTVLDVFCASLCL